MLILGDCMHTLAVMADDSVDLILSDPPYRVISGGANKRPANFGYGVSVLAKNDGKIFQHNDIQVRTYLPQLFRVLKPGGHCYLMTNNLNLRDLLNAAKEAGFGFHNLLAWRKNTATPNRWYMKEIELTCMFYKVPSRNINDCGAKQVFEADNPRGKVHPTEKPISLMQHYVENSSLPGELVLDPFMGSGTTGVACTNTGRRFIGIEKDPEFFKIAERRIRAWPW